MLHLQLSDADVERILAGDHPRGRPDYAEVASLMRQLRAQGAGERVPPMSPQLLASLDEAELRAQDELRDRRESARRDEGRARRRWQLVGAAAMVVMLAGVVAAHLGGAFEGTSSTQADSSGDDNGTDPDAQVAPPPTETTAVTAPPTTAPPVTIAPTAPPVVDDGGGRGDERGPDDRWDDDWHWDLDDDGHPEWGPRCDDTGCELDFDGPGGRDPYRLEQEWIDECGRDYGCIWSRWAEEHGASQPGDGPMSASP